MPEQDRALPVSIHGVTITFLGGISPVFWGIFLKTPGGDRAVNEPVFAGFFVVLILVMLTLAFTLRHLPDRVRPVAPLMQGAWLLRPLRGLASLINLVDKDPPKGRTDD